MNISNILKSAIAFGLGALALVGCADDDTDRIVIDGGIAPVLSIAGQDTKDITITPDAQGNLMPEWVRASFGDDRISADYTLVISSPESKKAIKYAAEPNATQLKIDLQELNEKLIKELSATPGVPFAIELRLSATPLVESGQVNKPFTPLFSNIIKTNVVTSMPAPKVLPAYYLVGSLFDGGKNWDISNTDYIFFRSKGDDTKNIYVGKFKAGAEFKIVPQASVGAWDGAIGVTDNVLSPGKGDNIKIITTEGYYKVTFDAEAMTIEAEKYDVSSESEFTKMGIIGDGAIDWNNDIFFTQAPYDKHLWLAKDVKLKAGDIKLRADGKWDNNWAVTSLDYGVAAPEDNFKITEENAGTYTVYFNDLTKQYVFIKK